MVSSKPKSNSLPINREEIDEILTKQICESIGAILISFNESTITLGAMNPLYSEVKKIAGQLKEKFNLEIEVNTISAEEFEKWFNVDSDKSSFANNDTSNKIDVSKNEKKDIENPQTQLTVTTDTKTDNNNSDELTPIKSEEKPKTILNELIEKSKLETNDVFEFDFFDDEDEDEDEENSEIIEDSELLSTDDPIVSAVGSILSAGGKLKASDIHVEPMEDKMRIRYRIDGVLKEIYSLPKGKSKAISSRLKVMSKLDIAEKRLPQDGRIRCSINKEISDYRVSTLPGKWGE